MELPEGFNKEDFNWTTEDIIGMSLIIMEGSIDSYGNQIKHMVFYKVGKHKETGKVCIIPTDRNLKHEFANEILKKTGKLN